MRTGRWEGPLMVKDVDGRKVWGRWQMDGKTALGFKPLVDGKGEPLVYDPDRAGHVDLLYEQDWKAPAWLLGLGAVVMGVLFGLLLLDYAVKLGWLS